MTVDEAITTLGMIEQFLQVEAASESGKIDSAVFIQYAAALSMGANALNKLGTAYDILRKENADLRDRLDKWIERTGETIQV